MQTERNSSWKINLVFLVVFTGLFYYVFYRAQHLSFTHDESLSFTIINGNEGLKGTANHHVLNTWLMAICSYLFGNNELSLRFPNVIAFLLYLVVCYKLFNRSSQIVALFVGIPLLFFNSYLLDFFSLARGYGLSTGLMMVSLYFFLRRGVKEHTDKTILYDFVFTMIFAWLSLWANLNMVNFYIAILVLGIGQYILYARSHKVELKKRFLFTLLGVFALVALLPAIQRLLLLKETGQLYYGSEKLDDTLVTMIVTTFDFSSCPPCGGYLRTIIKVAFIAVGLYVIYRRDLKGPLFKMFILILLIFAGLFAEHYFFKALYPLNRTAIYMVPMYSLMVYYFFADLIKHTKPVMQKISIISEALIFCLPITYFFITTLKKNFVNEWIYDAHTKEVMEILQTKLPSNNKLMISNNWLFDPSMNYYIQLKELKMETHKIDGPIPEEIKFVYDFSESFKEKDWKEIAHFEDIGTSLYEKQP
jgi:hypothetical protein